MIAGVAEDEARDSVTTLLPSRGESERVALDTVSALSEACPRLSTTSGSSIKLERMSAEMKEVKAQLATVRVHAFVCPVR